MKRLITPSFTLVATLAAVAWLGAAGYQASTDQEPAKAVTFSEQVAPILYNNCVTCHRPGEAAPFSLISYEDVTKRAATIATVTKSRYMPPWHAEPGFGDFADERGLTDAQIDTIASWVAQGMPRGNAANMPKLPAFPDGWQLGKPDLVLQMPEAFEIPASGPDIYRNFAIPTGLTEDKYVRAVEFRPGTRRVVHHAIFGFVKGGSTATLAGTDGQPGFGGAMLARMVPAFAPAGDLGGWAVGTTPAFLPENVSWTMNAGSDFVLQLHLHPTGKGGNREIDDRALFHEHAAAAEAPRHQRARAVRRVGEHRHSRRREELRGEGHRQNVRQHAGLFGAGARALSGQGVQGHCDVARRHHATDAVDQGLGLQLAGPLHL
jgi:mono/diheme cytochrome c family protein